MKVNTPQEHQGKPGQGEGSSGRGVETEWSQIIDKDQGADTRTDHHGDPDLADRGDAVDRADPSMRTPMRIESILPDLASPGQSVIIQGDGLGAAEKVRFGDEEILFDVDGEVLVVQVPDGSGVVDVTVEGVEGESCAVSFTIA